MFDQQEAHVRGYFYYLIHFIIRFTLDVPAPQTINPDDFAVVLTFLSPQSGNAVSKNYASMQLNCRY